MQRLVVWGVVLCGLSAASLMAADVHTIHHENVLGTSLDLVVRTTQPDAVAQAESAALAEIDRLAKVVSTYDRDSEFSQWHASGEGRALSPELTALLKSCDQWRERSGGAFHPGAEVVSQLWRAAERANQLPNADQFAATVQMLRQSPWTWTEAGPKARPEMAVSLNAIAKGFILDAACTAMQKTPGVEGAMVVIGGDLKVQGRFERAVVIASPNAVLTGGAVLDTIRVSNQAVATSSGKYRGVTIAGQRFSHLIDPRTARPVDHILSATVVAPNAADADALATICSVLPVAESLKLIMSLDDTQCLIIDREGRRHASEGWNPSAVPASLQWTAFEPAAKKVEPWNGGYELKLDLEINAAGSGGRYRRPYVAAWVEDNDGFPVKTLVLWVQSSGPGPRWIPDLKRWYRSDRLRKLADDTDLVTTISEATRKPGQYSVIWDGTDDSGKLIKPGEYVLYVEAAREHGTYQLSKKKVTFGPKPFQESLEANVEIKAATFDYRKSTPAAASAR